MSKIYLWTNGIGWELFDHDDVGALSERNISICDHARIGDGAIIGYGARIGYGASIGYGAIIGDGARIGDGAIIGDGARIGYGAIIGYGASIGYGAIIGDGARIGYGAIIGDRATPIIIYIIGSKFTVSYWGEDRVDIGCESHSIAEWESNYHEIGIGNGFSEIEIEEYLRYLEMIKSVHISDDSDD